MDVDWSQVFGLTVPPLEMVVRGSAMYWALLLLFRFVVRRRAGAVGMADILLLVIIADAAQNGMSGDYRSFTDGLILVGTIIGWNTLTNWLCYRSPRLERILEPPPLLLIKDGRVLHRHLRQEMISINELRSKLREHGVTDIGEVKQAYMESDGEVSVIKR